MSTEKKAGFFEWIAVSTSAGPESIVPPSYDKPPPPRKRTRRRYEKGTQTEGFAVFHAPIVSKQIQTDPAPPVPPPDDLKIIFVFISGMILGLLFKQVKTNI